MATTPNGETPLSLATDGKDENKAAYALIESVAQNGVTAAQCIEKKDEDSGGDICPICRREFEEKSECATLPCNHDLCKACIDHLLNQTENPSCPTCRTEIDDNFIIRTVVRPLGHKSNRSIRAETEKITTQSH